MSLLIGIGESFPTVTVAGNVTITASFVTAQPISTPGGVERTSWIKPIHDGNQVLFSNKVGWTLE